MEIDETRFKRYLLGELCWELEQHPQLSFPFAIPKRELVEVLTFQGYDDLRVRIDDVVYEVHLSWQKSVPPVIIPVANPSAV